MTLFPSSNHERIRDLAVYQNEIEHLLAAAESLAATQQPITALREWLLLLVDYLGTKHRMHEVLSSMDYQTSDAYSSSSKKLKQAGSRLVDRFVESRDIPLEVEPLDLLRALAGWRRDFQCWSRRAARGEKHGGYTYCRHKQSQEADRKKLNTLLTVRKARLPRFLSLTCEATVNA